FLEALLVHLDVIRVDDVDLKVLQNSNDVFDLLWRIDAFRKPLVNILKGEEALLLRQANQPADALIDDALRGLTRFTHASGWRTVGSDSAFGSLDALGLFCGRNYF